MPIQNLSPKLHNTLDSLPPALAAKTLEFIFHPADYVHLEHLTGDQNGPDIATATFLLQHTRSRNRISKTLAVTHDLNEKLNFTFSDPLCVLALLNQNDIRRVARIATLSTHCIVGRNYTDEKSIRKIKHLVGEAGFSFALANTDGEFDYSLSLNINQFLLMLETDTMSLLHEWLDYLTPEMAARVRLKFPKQLSAKNTPSTSGLQALTLAAAEFAPNCIGYSTDFKNGA